MFVALPIEMSGKNYFTKTNKQSTLLQGAVRLFILSVFFFASEQPSAFAATQGKECVAYENSTCHLSEDLFNNSVFPLHLPFRSIPEPIEPEASNENEQVDHSEDDWNPSICKYSSYNEFNFSASLRCNFFQLIHSGNLSTVPLFILYHSWKSFLL